MIEFIFPWSVAWQESFNADYFLLIASGYRKANAKKKKSKHTDNLDSIEFYNFETAAYLNVRR
jgi:hypothetical protein